MINIGLVLFSCSLGTGKALCMLTKQDFCRRLSYVGDVLYNHVQERLGKFAPQDEIGTI